MSKQDKTNAKPLNTAKAERADVLHAVAPDGTAGGKIEEMPGAEFLHRTAGFRQKSARAFLQGKCPGLQQRYAPNAKTSDVEGWVEDDETVERLRQWRQEAPYG